jgi:methionyl-tRNA synthetase
LHALIQFPNTQRHLFFCGIDNLCASGILVPYILSVIGIDPAKLPIPYVSRLALLDGEKFSTSRNHLIAAIPFLKTYHPERLRIYFSTIYDPRNQSEFSLPAFLKLSNNFIQKIQSVINRGRLLLSDSCVASVEAGDWLQEDQLFYTTIKEKLWLSLNYSWIAQPKTAMIIVDGMINLLQDYLTLTAGTDYYSDYHAFRTRIVLNVYAYRSMMFALFPITPTMSSKILHILGTSENDFLQHTTTIPTIYPIDFEAINAALSELLLERTVDIEIG